MTLSARGLGLPGRLRETDLDLERGTLTALVGPNGAGKTSLLHAIAGIGRPAGGVHVAGRKLADVTPQGRPALLGYVPASRELAWPLTVSAFVGLTAPRAGVEVVADVLAAFDLDAFADRRVDRLSAGERTRVMIARALLPRPAALLLDEPFANLDPLWQLRLAAHLRTLAEEGMTILLSVHDLDLAGRIADRVVVVNGGAVVGDGRWEELGLVITDVFGVSRDPAEGWVAAAPR